MLIRQVALFSKTKKVTAQDITRVSAALQKQVTRDFTPIWNIQATVDGFASEADVPAGYWKIAVMDKIPVKGAGGFHLDKQGQPFADVLFTPSWSLTASHECLEMLADPFGHQIATGPSPKQGQGRVTFLVEVCDPCEAKQFAYTINTGTPNEVVVSDFYTPDYFSPTQGPGVRYSFRGNLTGPRQVLNGGYLSWQFNGHIWQLFGPAELGHFVDQGIGTLNRENTDKHAFRTRSRHHAAKRPAGGRGRLTAAGGQCNLTRDPFTGDLQGTAGAQTTVQIKDPTGAATFQSISYDGSQIGSNTASVSFAIKGGTKTLSFVYAAPVPGDNITLTDPCGAMLDTFPNDFSDPTRAIIVLG